MCDIMKSLLKIIDLHGGKKATLVTCLLRLRPDANLTNTHINNWLNRDNKIPPEWILPLCESVQWQVTPHELSADLYPHPDDGLPDAMRGDGLPAVFSNNRKVEQSAARLAHNQEVAGSNPALATNNERAA